MRRALTVVALLMGCGKPLAPVPAPPDPQPQPEATAPRGHAHRPPRDPRGGYRGEDDHREPPHRTTSPDERPPPHPPPTPDEPDEPDCKPGELVVTRCISGGAAYFGPDGRLQSRRSCSTQCSATAPQSGRATECRELEPRHWHCDTVTP